MQRDIVDIAGFTLRRIGASVILVACLLTLVFILAYTAPGDPVSAALSPAIRSGVANTVRGQLGLDRPLLTQYVSWLGNCLHGDLGTSISYHRPVADLIGSFLPNTALLAYAAIAIEFVIGGLLGILAARYHRRWIDRIISQTGNTASRPAASRPTCWRA